MSVPLLSEALTLLQEEFLDEYEFMAGPGMIDRPEAAGDRNYNTLRGASKNFRSFDDNGPAWPYEDDGEVSLSEPSWEGGKGVWGRGDRPGSDVSGGPPTPRYGSTWEGGPENEGADWDELQRHGDDKVRNVWRDTPDGKEWTKLNNEAMGVPFQTGPVAPMDGPQHHVLHFSSGTEEGEMLPSDEKRGPAGQWGGPETVPGGSRGWASSPEMGSDPDNVWKVPENTSVREFFDPSPVSPSEGSESSDSFSDRLGGTSIFVVPKLGPGGEFLMSPDAMGAARGTYGIHTDGRGHDTDLLGKRSAWELIQQVVDALSQENSEERGEGA